MNHVLLSARLHVPDLDSSADHLVSVLGLREARRDATSVALALPGQPACLELVTGAPAVAALTLATGAGNLAEITRRAHERDTQMLSGGADALRLRAPHGVEVEVVAADAPSRNRTAHDGGPVIAALDHLSFTARDLAASVAFYRDVLGFRVSDRVGDVRFWLRCNANHHTVALFAAEEDGLQHYAFCADGIAELKRLGDALAARDQNFLWGIGRHGLGENVFSYHLDPAGAILEVCSDMVQIPDEDDWVVGVWDPDTIASAIRWGQLPPPSFRTTTIPAASGLARA